MKNIIHLMIIVSFISVSASAQMIMSAAGITPENVCKANTVYFLMENKPRPLQPIDSIESRINHAIKFVRENPTFEAKPAIQFAVNCKGETGGGFHVVTRSGNDELDNELLEFFKTVKGWKAGIARKKAVDSWYMWRLQIKDGHIDITNP
jgi:hypothetical protein